MNKEISSIFGILVILIIAIFIGGIILMGDDRSDATGGSGEMPPQPEFCTQEAKFALTDQVLVELILIVNL